MPGDEFARLWPASHWSMNTSTASAILRLAKNCPIGGQNESSLKLDYLIPQATLLVEERVILAEGKLTR
jgi:hypothetical protein